MASKKKPDKRKRPSPVVDPETTDELQKTDALDDFLFHATNYVYKKRKLFIALGIVLAASLLGGYGIGRYIDYRDNLRNEGLYQIERTIRDDRQGERQQYEKALSQIDDFLADFPGSRQAAIALFYRSSLNFRQEGYREAEKDLRRVIELLEKPSEFHLLASIYLSNILRDQGKTDQAVEILQAAKSEIMTDIVMMEIAETHIAAGNRTEAKSLLETIVKDYPRSLYRSRIEQLLATM